MNDAHIRMWAFDLLRDIANAHELAEWVRTGELPAGAEAPPTEPLAFIDAEAAGPVLFGEPDAAPEVPPARAAAA